MIYSQKSGWAGGRSPVGLWSRGWCFPRFLVWLVKASWLVGGLVRTGVAAGGWMEGFTEVCLSSEYRTVGFKSTVNCIVTDGGVNY